MHSKFPMLVVISLIAGVIGVGTAHSQPAEPKASKKEKTDDLSFDPSHLLAYAERWSWFEGNACPDGEYGTAGSAMPKESDCAHFVAHALMAGGVKVPEKGGKGATCSSGLCYRVLDLREYLEQAAKRYRNVEVVALADAQPGDILIWHIPAKLDHPAERHAMIVAKSPKTDDKAGNKLGTGMTMYSHTNARFGDTFVPIEKIFFDHSVIFRIRRKLPNHNGGFGLDIMLDDKDRKPKDFGAINSVSLGYLSLVGGRASSRARLEVLPFKLNWPGAWDQESTKSSLRITQDFLKDEEAKHRWYYDVMIQGEFDESIDLMTKMIGKAEKVLAANLKELKSAQALDEQPKKKFYVGFPEAEAKGMTVAITQLEQELQNLKDAQKDAKARLKQFEKYPVRKGKSEPFEKPK